MKIRKIATFLGLLLLGAGIGLLGERAWVYAQPAHPPLVEKREGAVGLINPLLDCQIPSSQTASEYKPMETVLMSAIRDEEGKGDISTVSVYFRSLDSSKWTGIDESRKYYGASLFKLAVAVAYYKQAEEHPEILEQQLRYTGEQDLNATEHFKPNVSLVKGQSYTVDELIHRMLMYSDNNADILLVTHLDPNVTQETFSEIGVPYVYTPGTDYQVDPRTYSRFLRVLYNATYLSKENSQRLLDLLTQADFHSGLAAGVPTKNRVAHKFGEQSRIAATDPIPGPLELHDCGIVYDAAHPYSLCVMTSGTDFDRMATAIQQISSAAYAFVDSDYKMK